MARTIREVARETGQELGQAISESKKFVRKRARKPKDMRFAVTPQPEPVQPSIGELITGLHRWRRR